MKQNFILVAILLAMLSIVNAFPYQLITTFIQCPQVPLITTTISPDPPVAGGNELVTISGSLTTPIVPGSKLLILFSDGNNALTTPVVTDICTMTGVSCPAKNLRITKSVPLPAKLPAKYGMITMILDPAENPIGCSLAIIGV
ncbi:hypothetical protein C1645_864725 [Glomus cerebriforme]|uniref:Phosphatidylglycerol/phosphatidylinositol transfer protein n=1 Tax=Glomus cerebriforme TaxID=658196 RepID=A0A397S615_9GLOM|nr:hypothetical protein C1645_864725 [Glomus cerebriforme]